MSDHEEMSVDSGFSTPVPELDDHRHQSATVPRSQSRRGTFDSMHSPATRQRVAADLGIVNQALLPTVARDFEHAVEDEEAGGVSPNPGRNDRDRSRRGTATTLDPRANSPPNSVKAFADARRRERGFSTSDPHPGKPVAEARRHEDNELHRTLSRSSAISRRSRRSRRYTNDNDGKSFAGSLKEAEDDVCFPLHPEGNKDSLHIDFDILEDFIAEEESEDFSSPKGQPQPRMFHDLRPQKHGETPTYVTSDGDVVEITPTSSSVVEKPGSLRGSLEAPRLENRFEFFSSLGEETIHAAEFGDLILPGEDVRSLFTLPHGEEEDGVWWLNMNNPTEDEIRAICKAFGIHPLTIEDISTQEAREKIELFPSYYFACFRSFHVKEISSGQEYEPFNIYVIVFREGTLSFSFSVNPHAAHVRKRITMLKDYVALSSDWICYALIDDIVDSFAPIITQVGDETDAIEDQVFIARNDDMHTFLRKIGMIRKNVMGLMKLLGGKADVLRGFTKRCNANYKVTPRMDIGLYLGDIQDHVVTMMTSLAHFEKMLSRSHSNYLAQLSIDNITQGNHANKVLSKITLLASILVPLNLICGMFGMNVKVPWREVDNLIPFFGIFGFLIVIVIVFYAIAKRMRYI